LVFWSTISTPLLSSMAFPFVWECSLHATNLTWSHRLPYIPEKTVNPQQSSKSNTWNPVSLLAIKYLLPQLGRNEIEEKVAASLAMTVMDEDFFQSECIFHLMMCPSSPQDKM